MIHYILQIIVYQLLFLVVYDIFLKKETFFTWNRCYLLITPILSFILPFIKIDAIRETIPTSYTIALPEVLLQTSITNTTLNGGMLDEIVLTGTKPINFITWMLGIWIVGMTITLAYFVYKVIKIQRLKSGGILKQIGELHIVTLPNTDTAFSFFNTIFLGANLSDSQREHILLHETIHIKERHSLDMLFFEILRILCWFNPLVYIYQNKMMLLQEFTADAKAVSQKDKKTYYQSLLSYVFKTENISFINPFFNHSLIKKRISMLQKTKSSKLALLKCAFILPLILSMLVYVSCSDDNTSQGLEAGADIELAKIKTELEAIEMFSYEDSKPYFSKVQQAITKEESYDDDLFIDVVNMISEKITLHRKLTGKNPEFERTLERERLGDNLDGIPFAVIDQVPTFPGCSGENTELKECMNSKVTVQVNKEFNTSLASELGLTGINRIFVKFKISKEGNIVDIMARAPHPALEKEAIRVIQTLPQLQPGEQNGQPVGVLYSLPITFKVQ